MMKKRTFFVFRITLIVIIAGLMACEKSFIFIEESYPTEETVEAAVELNFTLRSGGNIKVYNGQTLLTDSIYYNSFWLAPATGAIISTGIWLIRDSNNNSIYQSAMPENGIDIKFPSNGNYSLEVSGTYQENPFLFNNITIVVGTVFPPPPTPATATSPVRLYNFSVSGGTATVNVAISKAQWQSQSGAVWFHVKRINNLNFLGNQAVTSTTDSVFFSLSFSAINQAYVEFNSAFHDGSTGGVWLIPGYGTPPSILYTGAMGLPYEGSENFFGFRFHDVGAGVYELRTHSMTLILSTATPTTPQIPGNAGDGVFNNYQVRWSGYYHWFKTNEPNPSLRWRMGPAEAWNYLTPSPTIWISNSNYVIWEFTQLTGQFRWQNGAGTGDNFVPDTIGMAHSMYYDANTQELVKYMK